MADGTLTLDVETNADGVKVGIRDIEASVKRMAATVENVDEKTKIAIRKQMDSVSKLNSQYGQQAQKIVSLRQRLKELSGQKIATEEYKRLGKEIEEVYEKSAKLESELSVWDRIKVPETDSNFKAKEKELQQVLDIMDELQQKQKEMRKSGTAYVDPRSLSEYQNTALRLTAEELRLDDMNNRLTTSFATVKEKVEESGKKLVQLREEENRAAAEAQRLKEIGENAEISEEHIVELNAELQKLKERQGELAKAGVGLGYEEFDRNTARIAEINDKLKNYKKEITGAEEKSWLKELGENAEISEEHIVELNAELQKLKERQGELGKAGIGLGYEEFDQNAARIAEINAELKEYQREVSNAEAKSGPLASMCEKLDRMSSRLAQKGMKQLKSSMKSLIRTVEKLSMKLLKLSASSIAGGIRKISSGIFGIHKSANKSTSSLGTMTRAIRTLLKYSIGIRSMYVLMNKLRNAAVEGFQNLAQYSGTTNNSISMLQSSLTQLKNALATAFAPILTVAAPILVRFINLLSQALTYVGMFFGALTGQKTFTKAVAVQQDYAASLDKTADSAKKAAKALEGYLSPLDEINNYDDGSDSSSTDGTGGYTGPTPDQMFEEVPIKNSIKGIADKIRKLIKQEDWEGLGKYLAQYINKGLKYVYDAISWKNVGPKVTEFCDAFTRTFNSLVDNIDWDLLGRTVGAGITTLIRTFNRLADPATGINFERIGSGISQGLRGMIDEIPWREFGNALGNKFMIAWRMFDGFVQDMARKNNAGITGWQELGNAVAEALNGIFDKVNFSDIADSLTTGINGAFESLAQFTEDFDWDEVAENIGNGIATFIQDFKWKENGEALGDFLSHLCTALTDAITPDTFYDLGKGIGDFLGQLPWIQILKTAGKMIILGIAGALEGMWESEGLPGKIAAVIAAAFLAVEFSKTGIASFAGSLVAKLGAKLLATESVSALSGSISGLVSSGLSGVTGALGNLVSSALPVVGTAGLIAVATAGTVTLTKKIAELVETAQGGNGILSQTGGYLHDYTGAMSDAHAITQEQAEDLWKLIEADESAGKANNEMYDDMIQKLTEYGVSADKARGILEQYGAQAGVSTEFVEDMTAKVEALGTGFSETTGKIDTSSITVKDAIKGVRDVLYDLSMTSSDYAGTYQGILSSFNNTSGSAATAQEAFDMVYNSLKDAGVPLDELNQALAERFPSATVAVKTSVDKNIVGAQETVTSATGKMKTDAESNLSDVQKAAEDATSGVNTATVTNWGSSAKEVSKNLDQMKQTANLKLGEMQRTVNSHFSSQYNTMTFKWKKASERISQIIADMIGMVNQKMNSLTSSMERAGTRMGNGLAQGVANGTTGITRTLNNMISEVNRTIGNINNAISGVEHAFTFSYDVTGPTGERRWGNYWMNLPRVSSVPYLASGAVIPPRSEFLAVLGDQKAGNNIEAPESLLRKIVREESPQNQGGNTYNVSVIASGRKFLQFILEEGELQRSRNGGKNPFKLGEEW